ncbi:hypothetical protein [Nesterenkonia pannonica]|uniref:hypothetical protein n=1 Tax=Nesterenkonia pannonica TaxID=1548602 RepID=UPI0021644248|nr:hypothetical protein [Nesterenkonia pannonica]
MVAFGDPVSGAPKPLAVSADPIARAAEAHVPGSICTELARVLPVHRLRQVHRGVDQELTALLSDHLYDGDLVRLPDASQLTGLSRRVSVEHVSAAASGGRETVESPTAEVNRVVDLVFEHVRRNRNRSWPWSPARHGTPSELPMPSGCTWRTMPGHRPSSSTVLQASRADPAPGQQAKAQERASSWRRWSVPTP